MASHERVVASMLLSAVGDAVGYRNGRWEFCHDDRAIRKELDDLGGVEALRVTKSSFRVSDDTIQHLATIRGIATAGGEEGIPSVFASAEADAAVAAGAAGEPCPRDQALSRPFLRMVEAMATEHVATWKLMGGRAPGNTCRRGIHFLKKNGVRNWHRKPLSAHKNCGCGSIMRSMGIGLAFCGPGNRLRLVAAAACSSWLSHTNLAGMYAAVAGAAFTAFSVEGVPPQEWPRRLLDDLLPLCDAFLAALPTDMCPAEAALAPARAKFLAAWRPYRVEEWEAAKTAAWRDRYLRSEHALAKLFCELGEGWDAISCSLISYLAFHPPGGPAPGLGGWVALIRRSAVHAGDSDSTAAIAGAWYGASRGLSDVPRCNYERLEFRAELEQVAGLLWERSPSLRATLAGAD